MGGPWWLYSVVFFIVRYPPFRVVMFVPVPTYRAFELPACAPDANAGLNRAIKMHEAISISISGQKRLVCPASQWTYQCFSTIFCISISCFEPYRQVEKHTLEALPGCCQ
jgi:hypothetical protein